MRLAVLFLVACAHAPTTGGGGGGGQSAHSSGPVPAEVRKTVEALLGPNARIASEREDGATVYEAASQTKVELELSAAGAVQQTEVAIPVAALPSAVTAALAGKGTIAEAEVVVRPSGVAFEVEVGETEYVVDAAGTILQQEREQDEGKDEDEDD
jgi:hypothetical protein